MLDCIPEHPTFLRFVDYWFSMRSLQGLPVRESVNIAEIGTASNFVRLMEVRPDGHARFSLPGRAARDSSGADNFDPSRLFHPDILRKITELARTATEEASGAVFRISFGRRRPDSGYVDGLCLPMRSMHRPPDGTLRPLHFLMATVAVGASDFVDNWSSHSDGLVEFDELLFDVGLSPENAAALSQCVSVSREACMPA